jgi:hypothetical protein
MTTRVTISNSRDGITDEAVISETKVDELMMKLERTQPINFISIMRGYIAVQRRFARERE